VRESLHACEVPYVLCGAQCRIERERLRHQPEHPSESAAVALWRLAINKDPSAIRLQQSGKDRERGGLARAIGSEQPRNFPGLHRKTYVVERVASAIALRDLDSFEDWCFNHTHLALRRRYHHPHRTAHQLSENSRMPHQRGDYPSSNAWMTRDHQQSVSDQPVASIDPARFPFVSLHTLSSGIAPQNFGQMPAEYQRRIKCDRQPITGDGIDESGRVANQHHAIAIAAGPPAFPRDGPSQNSNKKRNARPPDGEGRASSFTRDIVTFV